MGKERAVVSPWEAPSPRMNPDLAVVIASEFIKADTIGSSHPTVQIWPNPTKCKAE